MTISPDVVHTHQIIVLADAKNSCTKFAMRHTALICLHGDHKMDKSSSKILLNIIFPCALALIADRAFAQDELSTGLQFLEESSYRSIPLASTPLLGDIPNMIDLSDHFPEPGNQGQQGSCVGWAVSYLKTFHEVTERGWNSKDRTSLFSPSFIYNQIKISSSCDSGSFFSEAFNIIRRDGASKLENFPYSDQSCSALPDASTKQIAREFAVADWRRVNHLDEMEIKTQIASGFPVLIGMIVDSEFMGLGDNIYDAIGTQDKGGHAMVVVGYDDGIEAYKVINSWGTDWGRDGFGWISYTAFSKKVREAYVVQDIVVSRPVPVPVPVPEKTVTASVGQPAIIHNVPVAAAAGIAPGMKIIPNGSVNNADGKFISIVASFYFYGGQPLFANPAEFIFRDGSGYVASSSGPVAIGSSVENISPLEIHIPYYALNFPPTGGANRYQLMMKLSVFVDNVEIGQSNFVPFFINW